MKIADKNIFNLLKKGFGGYEPQIALMAFFTAAAGVLEGFGINAVIPLFSFAGGEAAAEDFISKSILKFFDYSGISPSAAYILIFIAALFIFKTVLLTASQYITSKISTDYEAKTRSRLLNFTLGADWEYLSGQKVGYLEQILIVNAGYCAALLAHISSFVMIASNLAVFGLIVVNLSFSFALLAALVGSAAYFLFQPWISATRRMSAGAVQKQKDLAHYVNENIIGMKSVKSLSAESPVWERGRDFFEFLKSNRIKLEFFRYLTNNALQLVGVGFVLSAFSFFYAAKDFNFASFAVMIYAFNKLFANIQYIQAWHFAFNSYIPHLESILNYEEEALRRKERDSGAGNFNFSDKLEFKNVSFSYGNNSEVLADADFTIKKGEMTGLIGPSGAGKTTVVDLLLRLLRPKRGKITLDGTDISEIKLKEWRDNVGYVSQDIFLSNDSILNNIKFYGRNVSYADAAEAAKMANIYDFIQNLPEKFDTAVGERGLRLSGGQRQRIALARALARKPQILILDEATSALDGESEALIQKSIESLRGKITVIAIAHRMSTIANFDKIMALADGKIIEEGSPRELLDNPESYFYKIYNLKK